jgi:PKD repeat protein
MAPSVQNTATWSAQSINSIDNFVAGLISGGCLSTCGPPIPPTAAFAPNYSQICTGSMVTFIDQSTDGPTSWNWSFPGGTPGSSTEQNPTITYNNGGSYNVTLTVSNGNGSNSTSQTISVGSGTDFFHYTDFETGLNGWAVENPSGGEAWTAVNVNSSRYGNTVMSFDNFNTNNVGSRDALVSPALDFSGRTFINLDIDYAYARFSATFRDSLVVYVSSNNGVSYTRVFAATENGSGNFATKADQGSAFIPADETEWCFGTTFGNGCLSLDISGFAGSNQARVKIENVNGFGNNMFIDNIAVTSDCQLNLPPIADFSSDINQGCLPLQVNFTDESLNGASSWNWSFPGGSPNNSTQQNPNIIYAAPGTYDVTLLVTNASGTDATTQFDYIIVEDAPIVDFDFTTNGLTVNFNNLTNTGGIYLWNFGDNSTSTQQNPTHTYSQGGTYTVALIVANDCGTDAVQYTIELDLPPIANFSSNVTNGCVPFDVQFMDDSENIPSAWNWTFDGGNPATSNIQNPMVTYDTPGTYDVILTVTNSAGMDETTQFAYIVAEDLPSANFNSTVNGSGVDFINNSVDGTTYLWDFGDNAGTSNDFEPFYLYNEDGIYTVTLETTNACGTDVFTQTVTISNPPANAAFSANTTFGCAPETVSFFDESSENATAWLWTFEGGDPVTSSDQNPTVVYDNVGTFNVTLEVSNASGSVSTTTVNYITIDSSPVANFTSSVTDLMVDFNNTSTNANSYAWDFGDNAGTSMDENPSYTYAADGTYSVILSATNDCGTITSTQEVVIATPPTAGFTANTTAGCAPMTVQFTNQSSENATSYNWSFSGGDPATSTEQNPTVVYNNEGTFDVTLMVSNGTGDDTFTETSYLLIDDVPMVDFMSLANDQTVEFTNATSNATSYTWDFGDNTGTSIEENPTYTYAADGTYSVILTATNACGQSMTTISVSVSTLPQASFNANLTTGCAPMTVQFMDMSSANTTSWAWSFPGGNPSSSTEQNPAVVYDMAGSYDVTLTATNGSGVNVFTQTAYIIVNNVPTADFSQSSNNAVATFTNTSIGATSFAWDFGDNTGTSADENPTYTYVNDGTYTVTLTATNDCGSVTSTEMVTIVTPPNPDFSANTQTGCAGDMIQFTDSSSDNTTGWNWTFEGGTPATSTEQNPSVTYSTPGTYSVTLEVSNSAGMNSISELNYITISGLPTGDFSTSVNNDQADFTNTVNGATSYTWDFGDNMGTSMDANPIYTYPNDGTYTVTMMATNQCGTITTTQEVPIVTPPMAGFAAIATAGCAPFEVAFMNLSSDNAVNYAWTFEDGNPATSTDENPVVLFITEGTFSMTLTVTNAAGEDTFEQMNYITVSGLPLPAYDFTTVDQTVTFNNNSSNSIDYSWDFGDNEGTSTEPNPTYTYTEDGAYTVTLSATNDCGTIETTEILVIATQAPIAAFQADNVKGCPPLVVAFENLSSDNTETYLWTFEGGTPATSTEVNPVVIFNNPGFFTVTLMATNALGSDTYEQVDYIEVNPKAVANFDLSVMDATVTFTNLSTDASTYTWLFGNEEMSDEENPVYTYPQQGNYDVTLIANGACGPDTLIQQVDVTAVAPFAAFDAEVREGCAPFEVTFIDLSTGNPSSYEWTFEGGTPATSNEANPTIVFAELGIYDVNLTVANAGGSHTFLADQYISVVDIPTVEFTYIADALAVSFTNNSTNGDSYLWDFGNNETSTSVSPSHLYDEPGTYVATLTVTNDCGVATFTEEIDVIVISTEEIPGLEQFQVFPNPNTGQFTLVMEGQPLGDLKVNFYNIIGQKLFTASLDFSTGLLTKHFDFDHFAKGVYVLQIGNGAQSIYQKVIIE